MKAPKGFYPRPVCIAVGGSQTSGVAGVCTDARGNCPLEPLPPLSPLCKTNLTLRN